MKLEIKYLNLSEIYVKVAGRLDLDSAVEFGTKIKDTIEDSEEVITSLVLDFREVVFISSYGLKVILELYKLMNTQGKMKLMNVSGQILRAFQLVGFDKFLDIEQ
ncbi:STAS domain-containing protein [bacterium]|nr:STAS domain-containing protein [bacterium]